MAELVGGGALEKLDPAERARAQRLALDTLRGLERADRILQKYLKKNPRLTVLNTLRLATVELCGGGAAHGVVNDAVEIVASQQAHRASMKGHGQRRFAQRCPANGPPQIWPTLRVPRLPKWLRGPLGRWPMAPKPSRQWKSAHFAGAPLDLTRPRATRALCKSFAETGARSCPLATVRLQEAGQVSTHGRGSRKADWWVQDAAAALPVPACLRAKDPVRRVLDLCAAPGGKTMQIAATGAEVTAVDDSETRHRARLRQNLETCRAKGRPVVVGDVMEQDRPKWDADPAWMRPVRPRGPSGAIPTCRFAKDGS